MRMSIPVGFEPGFEEFVSADVAGRPEPERSWRKRAQPTITA